jgi:hypothetical protein
MSTIQTHAQSAVTVPYARPVYRVTPDRYSSVYVPLSARAGAYVPLSVTPIVRPAR